MFTDMPKIAELIIRLEDLTGRITTQEGQIAELKRMVEELRGNPDKYPTLTSTAYHEAGHFVLWVLNETRSTTDTGVESITIKDEGGGLFSPEYTDLREPEYYQKIITGRYDPDSLDDPVPLADEDEDIDQDTIEMEKDEVRRDIKMRMAGLGAEIIYQSRGTDIGDAFLSRYLINNRTQPDVKTSIKYNTAIGNQTPEDGTRPLVKYLQEAINELRPLWGKVVKVARLLDEHRKLKGEIVEDMKREIYYYILVNRMKRVHSEATNMYQLKNEEHTAGINIINPPTTETEILKYINSDTPPWQVELLTKPLRDWSNPYREEVYGKDESLKLYRAWLDEKLKEDPGYLDELIGKDLACKCRPDEPCHGDIIIEKLREIYQ